MVRFILASALLVGCGGSEPQADADGKTVIRVTGSASVNSQLMPALADEYERLHPDVDIQVVATHSGDGIRALLEGDADLAAASRAHSPSEQEQALVNGLDLDADGAKHVVAVDVIAITTHPDNPIASLTYDQAISIWCSRTTDTWDLLGQDERPIRALTRQEGSGTRALFEGFFCGPSGIHDVIEARPAVEIEAILTEDPNAIAYMSMAEKTGKILGLRPDAQSPSVQPSQANIIRGVYPLYRDLYLYQPVGKTTEEAKAFLAFIDSPAGQEIVDEVGFVPLFLRPDRMDGPRPMRETIHFEPHSSTLTPRSQARLKLLAGELEDRAGEYRHVVLEGYTDSQEEDAEGLSTERAQAVEEALKGQLPDLFFEKIPRGSANPLAPNATPHGRYRNRRVQIYLAEEEGDD